MNNTGIDALARCAYNEQIQCWGVDEMPREDSTIPVPSLLVSYLRHAVVLAKLRALRIRSIVTQGRSPRGPEALGMSKGDVDKLNGDFESAADALAELLNDIKTERLFKEAREDSVCLPSVLATKWEESFGNTKTNLLLPSIYECRQFFALRAPSNVALRLKSLVKRWEEQGAPASRNKRKETKDVSDFDQDKVAYDKHIRAWGNYAHALVTRNGGWTEFFACDSLNSLWDVWLGAERTEIKAGHDDSFVQRVLALDRGRYIQVLCAPIGMLWPLWFIRKPPLSGWRGDPGSRRIGPTLPRKPDDLFIDVNVRVGDLRNLPYPFGYAETVLLEARNANETEVKDGDCWFSKAVNLVAARLMKENWNPPLLFAGRADQWDDDAWRPKRDSPNQNFPTAHLSIAVSFPHFASVWKNKSPLPKKGETKKWKQIAVAFEKDSWAGRALDDMRRELPISSDPKTRPDLIEHCLHGASETALVFSTFPADLAFDHVDVRGKFIRLDWRQIDSVVFVDKPGATLAPRMPSTILASGVFLARQPRMASLLVDLGKYLLKVIAHCRELRPAFEEKIQEDFRCLRFGSRKEKLAAAASIAEHCRLAQSYKNLGDEYESRALAEWFKSIGAQMIESLCHGDSSSKLAEVFQEWGWAALLEHVYYSDIAASLELFTGGEA